MSDSLVIGQQTIKPGTAVELSIPVAKLYTHAELTMPVKVIHSKSAGPILFICAALHGDEINGVEIIRRLLKVLSPIKIKGTVLAVPIVNTHGFVTKSRYLPDRRDLNRSFPGSDSGSLAARLAHLFITEVVSKATHGIDLHTAAIHRTNLPQIRLCSKDKRAMAMAKSFNAPVILNSDLLEGSLRQEVFTREIPIIVYEGGEALRYNEISIRAGVNGVLSVMDYLGMLNNKPNIRKTKPVVAESSQWVRAPESGLLRVRKQLGAHVRKNDVLGLVTDPLGNKDIKVTAPQSGIIIGKTQLPLVDEGDALFHIATFEKTQSVAEQVSTYTEELKEGSIYKSVEI